MANPVHIIPYEFKNLLDNTKSRGVVKDNYGAAVVTNLNLTKEQWENHLEILMALNSSKVRCENEFILDMTGETKANICGKWYDWEEISEALRDV